MFSNVYNYIMKISFYTATEAAQKMGISKELMARYCREKRLSECIRKGHTWLIPAKALNNFRSIQREYKPGRPRKAGSSVFWREKHIPNTPEAIHIMATRSPSLIPHFFSKSATRIYIRSGRTKLEQIVRKAMIEGLYDKI